jgi:uncharacterized protein YuzE
MVAMTSDLGNETMKITYDGEVDALYIRFLETTVTTQHVAEGIAVDYAADGRIAGIEILDARKRFGDPDVFRRVILEDIALAAPPGTNDLI